MSVATRNPFALLDSDETSRPTSPTPAPKEQPAPATEAQRDATKPRGGGPASRGGKYYQRGGPSKQSLPRGESGNLNQNGVEETTDARKATRGDGRGRGRGRGGRGSSGRGRVFDKHSQTGKVDTDKRIHQSWGGDDGETELKVESQATTDAAVETTAEAAGWGAPSGNADAWETNATPATPAEDTVAAESGERRQRREKEPEEEDNTLTLDQYIAQQREKEESLLPKLDEGRKANDGADTWKDVVPLQKNEENTYYVGKKQSGTQKAKAKKEEKIYLEIDARFERPSRGRGNRGFERGGRGGRGRGGRGGHSYNNNNTNTGPDVDDQKAFPSLS